MITTTESAHRVVSDWYPHMLIKSLAMVDELVDELIKAKYIRRIATGNPKRPWRYIYHADERKRWQASAWETVKTALREDQKDHGKANSHEDGSRAVHFGEAVSKLPLAVLKLALAHLEATHGKKAVAGMKAVIDQVEGKRDPHVTDPSPPGIRRTATEMDIAAAVSEAVNTLPPGVKSSKTTADTESRMGVTEITTHSGVTLTVDPNTATLVTKGPADKQEKLKSDPVFMAILAHVRGLLAKIRGIEAAPAKAEPPLPELAPAAAAARLASLHADLRPGSTIAVNGKNYRVESIYQKLSGAKEIDAQEGILGNGKTHKIVLPKSGTAGDVTIREMYPKWTPKGQAGDGAGRVVRVPVSQVYPGTANDAHIEIAAAGTEQTTAERYAAASAELESAIDDVYGKRTPQSHRGTWQKGADGEWKAKPSGTSGTPQVGDTIAVMNRKGRVGNMVVTSPPDARGLVSVVDPKKTAARATNVPAPATVDGNRALAREVRDRLTTADVNAMTPDQLNLARNAVVAGRDAGHLSPMEAATLLSRIDGAASKPAPVFTVAASPRPETTAIDPTPPPPDSTTRTFGTKPPLGGWTDADRVPAVPESVRESERQAHAAHREKVAAHHARLYASARPGRTLTIGRHELTINSGGPDTKGRRLLSATGGRGANYMVIIPATSDGQVRMIDRTGNTTVHPLTDVRTDTMAAPTATPAAPAPAAEAPKPPAALAGVSPREVRHADNAARGIKVGTVVSYSGRGGRKYAVTHIDANGQLSMRALSGGDRGSGPSAVEPGALEVHQGEEPTFSGAEAGKRERDYHQSVRTMASLNASYGMTPEGTALPKRASIIAQTPIATDAPSSRQLQAELGPRAKTKPVEVREAGEYNRQVRAMPGGSPFRIGDKLLTRTDDPGESTPDGGHAFTATDEAGNSYKVKLPRLTSRLGASIKPEGGVPVGFSLGSISVGAGPRLKSPIERADEHRETRERMAGSGDVFADARADAKRTADSRPWSMSSSQYQVIAGTTAPHIAEISGVQRQRMSKRELAGYQADRDARSAAAAASHNAWKEGVVAAYRAGQIDLKTPELSRDAKDVILRERSNDAEAGHEEYRQKFQASVSKTPEKGDVMHHPLHGTVEITKVNKNSVSVNAVRDGKRTPVGTVDPNWLSYGPHDVMDAGGKARTGMEYKTVETRQAEHKEAVKKWEATKRDIQASAPKSDNPGKASAEDVLAHAVATKDAGAGVHKVIFPKDVATNLGISSVAARRHLEQLAEQGKLSHLGDNRYRVPYDTSPEAEAGRRASHTPAPKPGKTSYLDQLTAGVKKAAPSKPAPISLKLGESAQSFVEIYLTDPAHDGEFPGAMVRGPKGLSLVVDHEHAEAAAAWMTDAVNGLDDELVEDDRLPKHLRRLDADTRRIIRNTRDAGQKLTSMIWQQAKEQREREKAEKSQRRFKLTLSKSQAFVG